MVFYVYEEPSCMMAKKPSTPKMKSEKSSCHEKGVRHRAQPYDCRLPYNRGQGSKMPKFCLIPALVPMSQFCFYDFMLGGRFVLKLTASVHPVLSYLLTVFLRL